MTADLVALAYALMIYAMAESNQDEGSASSLGPESKNDETRLSRRYDDEK